MSARSCGDCANMVSWSEYGQHCADCGAEPAASSVWRENLLNWGMDPGPYCDQFVFVNHAAEGEALYLLHLESVEAAREWQESNDR